MERHRRSGGYHTGNEGNCDFTDPEEGFVCFFSTDTSTERQED